MNVEDQYMDDLFGDGGDSVNNDLGTDLAHHITTATAPVPKGLPERLDTLAGCNCCRSAVLTLHTRYLPLQLIIATVK